MAIECSGCGTEYEDREDLVKNPQPWASGKVCVNCAEDLTESMPDFSWTTDYLKSNLSCELFIMKEKKWISVKSSTTKVITYFPRETASGGDWEVVCHLEKFSKHGGAKRFNVFKNAPLNDEIQAYLRRQGY